MHWKIDRAGRLVLPKPVRERLGVPAGGDIEVLETAEGYEIRSANPKPSLARDERGLWVYDGEIPRDFDIVKAVDDDRDFRARRLSGL